MTAELVRFTDEEWVDWLNKTHKSIMEVCPGKSEEKLAEFLVEVAALIEDNIYPMTREGFSMFLGDVYAAYLTDQTPDR